MSMVLNNLPSVEDMIAALASPVVPTNVEEQGELSVEEMIKEIYKKMVLPQQVNIAMTGGGSGGSTPDLTYDSSSYDYNGTPQAIPYNGV